MLCNTEQTTKKFQAATQMHNFTSQVSFNQDNFNLLTQLNKLSSDQQRIQLLDSTNTNWTPNKQPQTFMSSLSNPKNTSEPWLLS
jgi:hypothetical protein